MKKRIINEDGSINFESFNQLNEAERISYMEKWTPEQWTPEQWIAYRMQNTISDEECFGPLLNKLDKEIAEENGS